MYGIAQLTLTTLSSSELLLYPQWGLSYYYCGIYLTMTLRSQTAVNIFPQCQFKELLLCQLVVSGDYPTTTNKSCQSDNFKVSTEAKSGM